MKKYDLYIPCGSFCATAFNLKANGLRTASYPFDWVGGMTMAKSTAYILQHFENFLNKDNMSFCSEDNLFLIFKNEKDITFNHDFLKSVPFNEMFETTKKKYNRRIERFYQNMNAASSICFLHYTNHDAESIPEAISNWENFVKHFPNKKLELIYIKESENVASITAEEHSENVSVFYVPQTEQTPDKWKGNIPAVKTILQNYKLTFKANLTNKSHFILKQTQKRLLKLMAECFPTKKLRKKARTKLNINTYMWND